MPTDQQDPDTMLSVAEVADLVGLNPATIRYWVASGRLQAVDVTGHNGNHHGSRYRIYRSALRRFVDDCRLTRIDNTAIRLGDENDE